MLVLEGVLVPALAVSYGATGMASLVVLWALIDVIVFKERCTWCMQCQNLALALIGPL
jgi:hypothetical protein